MKCTCRLLVLSGLLAFALVPSTWADGPASTRPATQAPPPAPPKSDAYRLLADQIRQGDAGQIDDAVAKIKTALEADREKAVGALRGNLLKVLFDIKRFGDVADLALQGTLLAPADTQSLEFFQTLRVQSLLAQGKNSDALAESKRLFNVAGMKGTSDAVMLVCQCLNAASPDDREVIKRFRREQMEAAQSATQPASLQTSTLGKIALDGQAYEAAIKALTAEDYRTLVARGNLLLLAGRAEEAHEVVERAYTLAADRDLVAASENLARAMRAEDGAIGRANAWIISIRPQATTGAAAPTASGR